MERTSYYTCVEPTNEKQMRICFSDIRLPPSLKDRVKTIAIPADLSLRQHPAYIDTAMGKSVVTVCIDGKTNIRVASNERV